MCIRSAGIARCVTAVCLFALFAAGCSGDIGGGGGDDDVDDSVPNNAYCSPVADWDPIWNGIEHDVLSIVNQRRSEGANCGSEGSFSSAPPLAMVPGLRCAARVHSMDMSVRDFFDHTNPDNESPWDRMESAGYNFSAAGENIAAGQQTAESVMAVWMSSDGHCSNIMEPNFTQIGVGYYPDSGPYWTQTFGRQ